MSLLGRLRGKTLADSVLAAQRNLDKVAETLVRNPGRCRSAVRTLEETAALLEAADIKATDGHPSPELDVLLENLRTRMMRVHGLLEAALQFQCGTLLTNPAAEITYTPDGDLTRADSDIHLTLQA